MTIHVTAEHIAEGRPDNTCFCAVALALQAATCSPWTVDTISAMEGGRRLYPLPDEAVSWMQRFDRGDETEPFIFEFHSYPEAAAAK